MHSLLKYTNMYLQSLMLEEAQKLLRTEEGKLKDDLAYDTLFDAAHQYYTRLTKLAGEVR